MLFSRIFYVPKSAEDMLETLGGVKLLDISPKTLSQTICLSSSATKTAGLRSPAPLKQNSRQATDKEDIYISQARQTDTTVMFVIFAFTRYNCSMLL